jgi:CTP synthase (UTP-ammonia lyase)
MKTTRVALLGEHNPAGETHIATAEAIRHSAAFLGEDVSGEWISSSQISAEALDSYDGLWVAPGPPHLDIERSLRAIRYAREEGIPVFGNCGGFQLIVIEMARNFLGISAAHHEEYCPTAAEKVIVPLSCSLVGQALPIAISSPSVVSGLYRRSRVVERFYCRYGINTAYRSRFFAEPLKVSAIDDSGEIRVIELEGHPFFLATLYVPQVQSTPTNPHPLVTGFLHACVQQREA